jgi:hypothetical protein
MHTCNIKQTKNNLTINCKTIPISHRTICIIYNTPRDWQNLSYEKMMHDPVTAEIKQTAFGKDFGGMAQGDNKRGQKGTNAMFVMTHD